MANKMACVNSPTLPFLSAPFYRLLILRNGQRLALRGAPDLMTGRDQKLQTSSLVAIKECGLYLCMLFSASYIHLWLCAQSQEAVAVVYEIHVTPGY
jgi:hypothetical protein